MSDDDFAPAARLVNFVSEDQLAEARRTRGPRVEDGTAQRDRPLFEILRENKDKRDAEFNERFKHRPPKALDEDETEFLEKYETSKREYERQIADDEAEQLRSFQARVTAKSLMVHELKEVPPPPKEEELKKPINRKNPQSNPLVRFIKVVPQAKKAKLDPQAETNEPLDSGKAKTSSVVTANVGLVSYSDESDEDD
ncbi:uncharacterized protein LOC124928673 [Impatiens glandulifera]|uniref:uncharacterized protein LOC124928673 n=1 Tax=Impatiens glandulifera TaxID=253017 RepID=UPI001FB1461C|nr:uncharacterized protein LOC124928673 [Impatiens glandulifera]